MTLIRKIIKWAEGVLMSRFLKISDIYLFEKLGKDAYLRNGVGYGHISDDFLYDNGLIEIGIGRTQSGYGDWTGGDYESTCPLSIIIDRNYTIRKIKTDSFYNSKSSRDVEKIAKSFVKSLQIGDTFLVKDKFLGECLEKIFAVIPCKWHVGFDVYRYPHMIEYFAKNDGNSYLRDSKYLKLKAKGETK